MVEAYYIVRSRKKSAIKSKLFFSFLLVSLVNSSCPFKIIRKSRSKIFQAISQGLKITAKTMKFFIKDFFSKCDQIRIFLWI